jgi:hypothetical protein
MLRIFSFAGARPWEGGRQFVEHLLIRSVQIFILGLMLAVIYALWASIPAAAERWLLIAAILAAVDLLVLIIAAVLIFSRRYRFSWHFGKWVVDINITPRQGSSLHKPSKSSASM